jgi:3-oxoadipate enol-lactonase
MPYLNVNNAKIYYETWGETGGWITLINGFSRSLNDFKMAAKYFVQHGFRILSLDNRGSGRTESGPFSMQNSVDDVEVLWRELGIKSSGVLGISYGGALAIGLAIRRPAGLERLMVVSSSPTSIFIEAISEVRPENFTDYFSAKFQSNFPLMAQSLAKEMSKNFIDPIRLTMAKQQRAAMRGYDYSGRLAQINVPTLILHGVEDKIISVEAAQDLARNIAGATLKTIPQVGHLFLAEAPTLLYETAAHFFSKTV